MLEWLVQYHPRIPWWLLASTLGFQLLAVYFVHCPALKGGLDVLPLEEQMCLPIRVPYGGW